jgi:hypothetical protein
MASCGDQQQCGLRSDPVSLFRRAFGPSPAKESERRAADAAESVGVTRAAVEAGIRALREAGFQGPVRLVEEASGAAYGWEADAAVPAGFVAEEETGRAVVEGELEVWVSGKGARSVGGGGAAVIVSAGSRWAMRVAGGRRCVVLVAKRG